MGIGGWIFVIFIGLIMLLLVANVIHWLYRKVLEHMFREYEEWRRRDIPKSSLTVSAVEISSDGDFSIRLDHRRGAHVIHGKKEEIWEAIALRVPEIMSELGKKDVVILDETGAGKFVGSVWLRFDDLCLTFPITKSD